MALKRVQILPGLGYSPWRLFLFDLCDRDVLGPSLALAFDKGGHRRQIQWPRRQTKGLQPRLHRQALRHAVDEHVELLLNLPRHFLGHAEAQERHDLGTRKHLGERGHIRIDLAAFSAGNGDRLEASALGVLGGRNRIEEDVGQPSGAQVDYRLSYLLVRNFVEAYSRARRENR